MKSITKYLINAFIFLSVLYPVFIRFQNISWSTNYSLPALVFPFLGLIAASLLWLHSISGVLEVWLRRYIDFDWFVQITASIILLCLLLHPLLLLISLNFSISDIYIYYGTKIIVITIIAWLLLIIYDIVKPFKKRSAFFAKHWNKVLIISNIGFLIAFYHELVIGSDLQSGPLRSVWIFYGITAIASIIYTYSIMPFLKKP